MQSIDSSQFKYVNRSVDFGNANTQKYLKKLVVSPPMKNSAVGGFAFVSKSKDSSVEPNDSLYQLMPMPD